MEIKEESSAPEKADYLLLEDSYNEGCITSVDGRVHSGLYEKVTTFPNISEYSLWDTNFNILDSVLKFPGFDLDSIHTYQYELYKLDYPHWRLECYGMEDGFPVQPQQVVDIID